MDRPYPVTKVYLRAVTVDLLSERRIFPIFYISIVHQDDPAFPGQDAINLKYDRRTDGIVSDDEKGDEWFFEEILDSCNTSEGLQYRIKWLYPHRPIWEPAVNVQGYDSDIATFYIRHPRKPGPPV